MTSFSVNCALFFRNKIRALTNIFILPSTDVKKLSIPKKRTSNHSLKNKNYENLKKN